MILIVIDFNLRIGPPMYKFLATPLDTALQVAVRYDNDDEFEIVRELMKEDPKLAEHVNNAGESALFLAVERENYKMARHVLSAAPDDCSYAGRHSMNVLHALVLHTSCCKCCSIQPAS